MTIFLTVLKVIGIVLLVILAVLIALLLIILFAPIRYRITGDVKAEENHYDFRADFTWILHLFHGRANYIRTVMEDEVSEEDSGAADAKGSSGDKGYNIDELAKQGFHYELRVLHFFKILPKDDEDEEYIPDYGEAYPEYSLSEYRPENSYGESQDPDNAEKPEENTDGADSPYNKEHTEYADKTEDAEAEDHIPNKFSEKLKDFTGMLKRLPGKAARLKYNAGCKINDFCDKIGELREKALHLKEVYEDESTSEALKLLIAETMRILRAIRPRQYRIDLTYGFNNPAITGEVTGILALIFLSAGRRAVLRPDFDRQVIDGEMFIKGRIRVITLVIVLWRLYFNKDFRKFYREVRA